MWLGWLAYVCWVRAASTMCSCSSCAGRRSTKIYCFCGREQLAHKYFLRISGIVADTPRRRRVLVVSLDSVCRRHIFDNYRRHGHLDVPRMRARNLLRDERPQQQQPLHRVRCRLCRLSCTPWSSLYLPSLGLNGWSRNSAIVLRLRCLLDGLAGACCICSPTKPWPCGAACRVPMNRCRGNPCEHA